MFKDEELFNFVERKIAEARRDPAEVASELARDEAERRAERKKLEETERAVKDLSDRGRKIFKALPDSSIHHVWLSLGNLADQDGTENEGIEAVVRANSYVFDDALTFDLRLLGAPLSDDRAYVSSYLLFYPGHINDQYLNAVDPDHPRWNNAIELVELLEAHLGIDRSEIEPDATTA
jgi:hypothetical protein